jgi:hypothetical protein
MQINKTQEHEDGTVTFEGTLTGRELDLVVSFGLNFLNAKGLMSMIEGVTATEVLDAE